MSSFLFAGEDGERYAYELEPSMFSTPFRRRVAERINEETAGDRAYQVLSTILEESVDGTKYEHDMIEILGASPFDLKSSKRIYDEIVRARKLEAARGLL
ncbi:hypothetical protein [Nitratifractor salsuginis]|uniref:hypothetical protein n=1 Tax=Nitratifractor salsuginis TaxID=269261 RepID=UPI0011D09C72|nr:hypothetical protein [Nitratifractor salsuginis]